ncbi:Uncharacterised protein [uncultured archaeon]|nr:Uncharacterised protein [uncultured archaeon]
MGHILSRRRRIIVITQFKLGHDRCVAINTIQGLIQGRIVDSSTYVTIGFVAARGRWGGCMVAYGFISDRERCRTILVAVCAVICCTLEGCKVVTFFPIVRYAEIPPVYAAIHSACPIVRIVCLQYHFGPVVA